LFLVLAGLLISLLSVAYPTFLISRLAPVEALKEQQKKKTRFSLQKAVLTFQFIASITLIACTVLFYRQVKYMQTKEMGFDSEGMVVVDINSGALRSKFEAIKTAFKALPEVQNVSVTSRVPGEWKDFPIVGIVAPGQKTEDPKQMIFVCADEDFIPTYDLKLYSGTNFTGTPSDSSKIMINRAAAEALGFKEPVGQFVEMPTVNWVGDNNPLQTPFNAQVIGIIDDFHFEDSHLPIRPMVIGFQKNPVHNIDYYSIKIKTASWTKTFASLKKVNDSFDPDNPIEYNILDDQFQRFYESDILRSRLLILFTGIIIFISCMGLFAITAYVLKHRANESGSGQVVGATGTVVVGVM
jgi:putative ABC transport system permease protein